MFPTAVATVALGAYNGLVLDRNGTVWVSGSDAYGLRDGAGDGSGFVAVVDGMADVAVASAMAAGLDRDSVLWVWGGNQDATLWRDGPDRLRPTSTGTRFRSIAGGGDAGVVAVDDDGVWLVGLGGSRRCGQLPMDLWWAGQARTVRLGREHAGVIDSDGALWTRGANRYGQCGQGPMHLPEWRRQAEHCDAQDLVMGDHSSWVCDSAGTWTRIGRGVPPQQPSGDRSAPATILAGGETFRATLRGAELAVLSPMFGTATIDVSDVAVGAVCAGNFLAGVDGRLVIAGTNIHGQLGVRGKVWPCWQFNGDETHCATMVALRDGDEHADLAELALVADALVAPAG